MKTYNRLLLLVLLSISFATVYAQKTIYIGKINEIVATYKQQAAASSLHLQNNQVRHQLPGGQLVLQLTSSKQKGSATYFFGNVYNIENSNFYMEIKGTTASGAIIMLKEKKYYSYTSTPDGSVYLKEEDIDKKLCTGIPQVRSTAEKVTSNQASGAAVAAAVPNLQSLPGAQAVLFLDFDGQTVTSTQWNYGYTQGQPIVADPASLSTTEMTEAWKIMSEDYRPFQMNVTTDSTVFFSAPVNRRMRVIFTPNQSWLGLSYAIGGIAYISSFTWGGTGYGEAPCWVFNAGIKGAGEAGSHESGHTLGLHHDGRTSPAEEYFQGQASWAPIMGAGYYVPVVQWSKGEYPYANNAEDDLNIISTQNGFSYRTDDHGNTINTATPLVIDANGYVSPAVNKGVITTRTDVDVFSFTTSGGAVGFTVNPDPDYPNLDVALTLRNAAGTVLASSDPASMPANIDATLTAGTYYLTVDGVQGALGANSDYASIGAYSIGNKDYCTPLYSDGCNTYAINISSFNFNTLANNSSGCGNGTAKGYTNYAPAGTLTTTVNKGQSYNIVMQPTTSYAQGWGVWIDYNGDKDFDDAGEFVFANSAVSYGQVSGTITIPATAVAGATRLRVRTMYNALFDNTQSCASFTWGEAEDYTITIAGTSGTPTITASGSTSNLCPGTSVTLTSSPANSYSWNTGATTQSITVTTGGSYTVTTEGGTSAPTAVSYLACANPTALTSSNLTATSAKLSWSAVPCAVSYTVRWRPINTTTWIKKNVTTNTVSITGLSPSTTYQWQVQTTCVKTPKTASAFAKGKNFTTAANGLIVSANEDMSAQSMSTAFDAFVFPNPASNKATLRISGTNMVQVTITDIAGKALWQSGKVGTTQIALPMEKLATGVYIVTVSDGTQSKVLKLVKQ